MLIQFLPDFSTWEEWNGQILHYFGEQQFPFLPEDKWVDVARAITNNPVFDAYGVPSPDTFSDWRVWARVLTETINGNGN